MGKKNYKLNYENKELKNIIKYLENELKTMEEEKLKSETLCKTNTAQLPHYRTKIVELKKKIKELTSGNSKRVDEKYAKSEIVTLTVNNKKLSQEIKDFENRTFKNIKDTDKIKLENEKTKATIKNLNIEILVYKSQIASLNEQLKVKDNTINGLILDNKIKDTNIKQCREENCKHQKYVKVAEKTLNIFQQKCKQLTIRHNNENFERSIMHKPAKSCSMKESLQKQIYKLQDKINEEKSKNSNLSNQIKKVTNLKEMDHTLSEKKLNDAQTEIWRLKILNKKLTLKNNGLEKYEDNNILKSKTKDFENSLTYMQHKLTNLENKRPRYLRIA